MALRERLARQSDASSKERNSKRLLAAVYKRLSKQRGTEVLPATQHFPLCTGQTGTNWEEDGRMVTLRMNGTAVRACTVWGPVTITYSVGSQ